MKKYFFLALICLTSLGVMAQRPPQQPTPQGNYPAQHDQHHGNGHHSEAYNEGYRDGYRDGQRDQQHNNHHGNQPGHHHPAPAPAPVLTANAEQVQWALQIIQKQSYDDKRMEVAKLCVVLCPFTTRDLGRMVDLFTMEDRKVDFLIFAHPYCPDKENYYFLRDKLRYRSDQDKLMERVQPGYRRP